MDEPVSPTIRVGLSQDKSLVQLVIFFDIIDNSTLNIKRSRSAETYLGTDQICST